MKLSVLAGVELERDHLSLELPKGHSIYPDKPLRASTKLYLNTAKFN